MDAIFTRRSVRQFSPDVVTPEQVELLLRAGMQAPSAKNQQAWEFLVVRGADNLEALSAYNPFAGCLKEASAAIVVLAATQRMTRDVYWQQDLGAVTQNILLQATSMDLGAVWLGTAPDAERQGFISKLYDLAPHLIPFSVIAVGHPRNENANKFVDRYDATRVHYIGE